jgi:hypothetical protein
MSPWNPLEAVSLSCIIIIYINMQSSSSGSPLPASQVTVVVKLSFLSNIITDGLQSKFQQGHWDSLHWPQ